MHPNASRGADPRVTRRSGSEWRTRVVLTILMGREVAAGPEAMLTERMDAVQLTDTLTLARHTVLEADADAVWNALGTPASFRYVTWPLLRFPVIGDRTGRWQQGEEVVGRLWLLGLVPFSRHHLRLVRLDADARVLSSDEHGGPIRSWQHDIEVEPLDGGRCRYTDRVAIDAGWATLPVAAFAWAFYGYRQSRWRRLARRLSSRAR